MRSAIACDSLSRGCSRRVPERIAECVAGTAARDEERQPVRAADVSYDDPGSARFSVPFERDHVGSFLASVEFHKHAALTFGLRSCEGIDGALPAPGSRP